MTNALVFDLDDTLFEEFSYVRSGFRVVAELIAAETGDTPGSVHDFLLESVQTYGRGSTFDLALRRFGAVESPETISRLVQAYRHHVPDIQLYPDVEPLLRRLRERYALAVVTDGAAEMQRRKVSALQVDQLVDCVVYCWEIGSPKPDPAGYARALEQLGVEPANAVVVGDHPVNDIAAGTILGAGTVRVRTPRFADRPNLPDAIPDLEVATVRELKSRIDFLFRRERSVTKDRV